MAADFVNGERRCCPFEMFRLEVEPYGKGVWLHLIEPEGAKPMIGAELSKLLKPEVAAAAGLA